MLEIIAIIYLTKKIGTLAELKGQKTGVWKFYTVAAWLVSEFIGIILAILIFRPTEPLAAAPLGYAFAIGSYFILRAILLKKPDALPTTFDFEQPQQPVS